MKIIEFTPGDKSSKTAADLSVADEAAKREILIAALPLICHKLKNKLTPISGYTQILQSRSNDEFARERLARIERNTAELADALGTLKERCRSTPLPLALADLNGVVADLAPHWRSIAANGTKVVLELGEGLPAIPLHAGGLRTLLLAMAKNAACALENRPAGESEIRIATRAAGEALILAIRDNGRGMSPEEAASAWTPFYSRFPGHAGLGLTLCERIVADHGASCAITSIPGEFSEFIVTFPLAAKAEAKRKKCAGRNSGAKIKEVS